MNWAHQADVVQSNGAVTVKSLSGSAYFGVQNPTGAVAKANQNAVTQAPTVIIQATGGAVFNYTSDCYILVAGTNRFLGIGKMPTATTFTGIFAIFNDADGGVAASYLLAIATGVSPQGTGATVMPPLIYPGVASMNGRPTTGSYMGIARAFTVSSATKCYP